MASLSEIYEGLFFLQASTYVQVSFAACLIYDIISTMADEATLVWPSRWSLTKGLYFYNRYSPIAENIITVNLLLWPQAPETCWSRYRALAFLLIVGSAISECILVLRTYALWGKNRFIIWSLLFLLVLIFIANIIITKLFFNNLKYGSFPLLINLPGCFATASDGIVWIEFVLFLIADSVVIGLMFIKGYEYLRYKPGRSALVVTLYEDGLLYYVCFVLISIANIVIFFEGPPELQNSLTLPTRTIHSMLTSHVILRIRAADNGCRHGVSMELSALAERSDIVASTSELGCVSDAQEPFSITNIAFVSSPGIDEPDTKAEIGCSPRLSRARSRATRSDRIRWGSGGSSAIWRAGSCDVEGSNIELQLFAAEDEAGPSGRVA